MVQEAVVTVILRLMQKTLYMLVKTGIPVVGAAGWYGIRLPLMQR